MTPASKRPLLTHGPNECCECVPILEQVLKEKDAHAEELRELLEEAISDLKENDLFAIEVRKALALCGERK